MLMFMADQNSGPWRAPQKQPTPQQAPALVSAQPSPHSFDMGASQPQYGATQWAGHPPATETQAQKKRNVIGIIALVIAILGTILACTPGAAILGWILLPFGFVLGLVGLFISGTSKATAIAAVIISILGTIAGVIFFIAVIDSAVSDAFGPGDVTVSSPDSNPAGIAGIAGIAGDAGSADSAQTDSVGTRESPARIGDTLSSGNWEVVVNSFTRNATAEVMAANMFNDPPPAGAQYALANITATYQGADSGNASSIGMSWVSDAGNVVRWYDNPAVTPDPLEGELYNGASLTGNLKVAIPEIETGLIRLDIGFGTEIFVDVG